MTTTRQINYWSCPTRTLRHEGESWFGAILVTFLFAVFISSFGACWVIDRFDLPGVEVLQLDRSRSNLEGKTYATFPELDLSSFQSSLYQKAVDEFINDRMPLRDDILLFNAGWQRELIRLSSQAHGFEVFPTFYGSSYSYDSSHDAIYQTLTYIDDATKERYQSAVTAFNEFFSRHSDKNIFFYQLDRLSTSSNNPTNELQRNVVNTEFLSQQFFNKLRGVTVIGGLQPDQSSSLDVFFRTDHHWNGIPAYRAYVSSLDVMQPDVRPLTDVQYVRYDEPEFLGSLSRAALCIPQRADTIEDYVFDMNGFEISVNGKERDASSLQHTQMYTNGEWDADKFKNRYAEYWHSDFGSMSIRNDGAKTDESLLIIRDSYGAPIERYFADAYQTVYEYDARHNEMTLDEFMQDKQIDDILVLMGSTNFTSDVTIQSLS